MLFRDFFGRSVVECPISSIQLIDMYEPAPTLREALADTAELAGQVTFACNDHVPIILYCLSLKKATDALPRNMQQ